jgi:sporulation protein YlmC with PRC-barrel domain
MLNRHIALVLAGTALISFPSLAQTNRPAATAPDPAPRASADQPATLLKPGQWRATKISGLDVYNNNNENIGEINELIVNREGKIESVVIGVGGFLGIGERNVAVPFDQVKWVDEPRSAATAERRTDDRTASTTNSAAPTTPRAPATTTGSTTNAPASDPGRTTGTVATDRPAGTAENRAFPDHAMVNMSKDQLRELPEVRYSR